MAGARTAGLRPALWSAALAWSEALTRRGELAEAGALRAEVSADLGHVAQGLPADLRRSFAEGPLARRSRSS